MFNKGSLSQSQNVRSLIQNSLLGLLLVLSPAIVFGIINPDILDISLDFGAIKPDPIEQIATNAGGEGAIIGNSASIQQACSFTPTDQENTCMVSNGTQLQRTNADCLRTQSTEFCANKLQTDILAINNQCFSARSTENKTCMADIMRRYATQAPRTSVVSIAFSAIVSQCGVTAPITADQARLYTNNSSRIGTELAGCVAANPTSINTCAAASRTEWLRLLEAIMPETTAEQRTCIADKLQSSNTRSY